MSAPYAGDDTLFADTIPVLDDSDLVSPAAAAWAAALEALADRTAFLEARIAGVAKPGSATQIIIPFTPLNVYGLSNEGGGVGDRFQFASLSGVGIGWLQTDVTDSGTLSFDVGAALPKKCRITAIGVHLACATHAADPVAGGATLPQLVILEEDFGAKASAATLDTQNDTPASQAAYEAHHYVESDMGGTPYVWDVQNDKRLYAVLHGESGTNTQANKLLFKAVVVTIEEA